MAALSDGAQQRDRDRAGPGSSLQHPRPWKDVPVDQDRPKVLRVNHRGDSRHQPDEVRHGRPDRQQPVTLRRDEPAPVLAAQQVRVSKVAQVRVELPGGVQLYQVFAPLAVRYQRLVALAEVAPSLSQKRCSVKRFVGNVQGL